MSLEFDHDQPIAAMEDTNTTGDTNQQTLTLESIWATIDWKHADLEVYTKYDRARLGEWFRKQPFPFSELPEELQRRVFEYYLAPLQRQMYGLVYISPPAQQYSWND